MNGRVPLARRYVFAERRSAAMATAAIAVAFLLVLILDGIFAGAMSQVTAYVRHSSADVIVSQSGTCRAGCPNMRPSRLRLIRRSHVAAAVWRCPRPQYRRCNRVE